MDAQEFRKDFLENVKAEAAATGEGSCAAFVDSMAQYLVEAEVLPDFTPAFYTSTTSKRKIYRVDGYVFDEFDYTMNLIIADYDGVEERTMGKVVSSTNFQRLAVFVDQALNTNLYREIEMSTPCADLIDLLRLEKERIRKYRLLIFTDADVSDTLKNLDNLDIGGIPAECQIWDIDRVFRVCCSDLGRQNIEIDFREYIPEGIPCLEASSAATAEYNSYLCIIPGKVLADIYDKYGSQLLEGNVRSFLSTKVAVNKKIRETILKCPSMFFAYNNGVSATAMDVQLERTAGGTHIVGARDFQIINGGQTTASLSNTRHKDKADLEGIYVQMKLTEIDESDMAVQQSWCEIYLGLQIAKTKLQMQISSLLIHSTYAWSSIPGEFLLLQNLVRSMKQNGFMSVPRANFCRLRCALHRPRSGNSCCKIPRAKSSLKRIWLKYATRGVKCPTSSARVLRQTL